jgi:SWI/SNF-related matrix-associated actin-dependent regulator 1 of chromatin subfamily A
MIRRLKFDVLKDLPKKNRKEIFLENIKVEKEEKKISNLQKLLLIGNKKVDSICKYLNELIKNNIKFLLFAHHKEILDKIENFIKNKNIKFIRIDGETNLNLREDLSNTFKLNEEYKIALLSITCAGTGLSFLPCIYNYKY